MLGLISCIALLLLLVTGTSRKPAVAFSAVLCLYGLKQWGQSSTSFFAAHRTFMNFAVALLVTMGIVSGFRRHLSNERFVPIAWVLSVLLFAYAFVTVTWSPDVNASLEQWSLQIPYVLMIVGVAPFLIRTADEFQQACKWTLFVGAAICALALFFGNWGLRGLQVAGDFLRSETNPLAIASLGGTVTVIAMVVLVTPISWWKKSLCITAALIGIAVILRSGSRGQLVAAAISIVVGMPMATRRISMRSWLIAIISLVVIGQVGWWIWEQLGVDSARWSGERSSLDAEGRYMMASTLISTASKDPLNLLVGLGNSSAFYYIGFYPHVAPLEILAEEGLLGFAIYCFILVVSFRNAIHLSVLAGSSDDVLLKQTVAALTALFVFEWVLTFKQGTLLSSVYVFAYGCILGTLARRYNYLPRATDQFKPLEQTIVALPNLMH